MARRQLRCVVGRAVLARALATILATAALVMVGSSSPAAAAGGENCWYETDPNTGEVKIRL